MYLAQLTFQELSQTDTLTMELAILILAFIGFFLYAGLVWRSFVIIGVWIFSFLAFIFVILFNISILYLWVVLSLNAITIGVTAGIGVFFNVWP